MRAAKRSNHWESTRQDFAGFDFTRAALPGVQWAGYHLQGACFRGGQLRGADMRGVDARGAIFDGADLTGADFSEALLHGASLRRARLQRARMRQAWLISAHIDDACVQEADFTGANGEWSWVAGVDFRHALMHGALFLNARGLSAAARQVLEARGGFTGTRPMILGRELYETGAG